MAVVILYREELKEYDFGEGHPLQGRRIGEFINFLKIKIPQENFEFIKFIKPKLAENSDLELVHSKEYIDFVERFYQAIISGKELSEAFEISQFLSADNLPGRNPGNLVLGAKFIVGAAEMAGELVWEGKYEKAISFGGLHHGKRNYGEGFCIFNDVAILVENLKRKYSSASSNLERILILDTDAHAGNGTAEIFYQDPKVLFIDIHQAPQTLYPGTGFINQIGAGAGEGFTVNCPLFPGAGWDSYQYIFENIIFPLTQEFQPQIIIRNGGSDSYFGDPLTQLGLTISDFKKIGENVRELAKISRGKEVDLIGSGYHQKATFPGWLALISGLVGIEVSLKEPEPISQRLKKDPCYQITQEMVKELKKQLKNYWKCFN